MKAILSVNPRTGLDWMLKDQSYKNIFNENLNAQKHRATKKRTFPEWNSASISHIKGLTRSSTTQRRCFLWRWSQSYREGETLVILKKQKPFSWSFQKVQWTQSDSNWVKCAKSSTELQRRCWWTGKAAWWCKTKQWPLDVSIQKRLFWKAPE